MSHQTVTVVHFTKGFTPPSEQAQVDEFVTSQLKQTRFRKADPGMEGINGVAPDRSWHFSLCMTRRLMGQHAAGQVLQIGHWLACRFVYDKEAVSIGNPSSARDFLKGAIVVATELVPGSAAMLFETAPAGPYNNRDNTRIMRERADLIWYPVVPTNATWTPGPPASCTEYAQDEKRAFAWPAQDFFIRQKKCAQPAGVAWHLLLPYARFGATQDYYTLRVGHTTWARVWDVERGAVWTSEPVPPRPAVDVASLFKSCDPAYWTFDIDDRMCPKSVPCPDYPRQVCNDCCEWLRGRDVAAPAVEAPAAAPAADDVDMEGYETDATVALGVTTRPPVDASVVLSMSRFVPGMQ